jgi:hypothetical protein
VSLTATGPQLPWHNPGAPDAEKCCCGGGCCMYPAAATAPYDDADLPLAGNVILSSETSSGLSGGRYYFSNGTLFQDGDFWRINFTLGELSGATYILGCLFGTYRQDPAFEDPGFPATIIVVDGFLGTYHVVLDYTGGSISGLIAGECDVNRVDLCHWKAEGVVISFHEAPWVGTITLNVSLFWDGARWKLKTETVSCSITHDSDPGAPDYVCGSEGSEFIKSSNLSSPDSSGGGYGFGNIVSAP